MLTYDLQKSPGVPLYEALYRCIRSDILSGRLLPGQKLPSKRALGANLKISKITVEGAYSQLLAEGYIRSREKVGYFVEQVAHSHGLAAVSQAAPEPRQELLDLTANNPASFPFSVWSRLQRGVMLDLGEELLRPLDHRGIPQLRQAIAAHLAQFRGMQVHPECIVVGAGTDFLYNLLVQLLGRDKLYAVEEPGYSKVRRIYAAAGARCVSAPLDSRGVVPGSLGRANVLHFSPSHHFPTGLVTPLARRQELLDWAGTENWLIEDDYDSEFRFAAHPLPAVQSMDRAGRVIYMNSFSKSLAPSIRISYMVLPPELMAQFRQKLGFYSCTVPSFEQYTLERFLSGGYFEKHINRMRRFYKSRRDRMVALLEGCPYRLTIREEDAGLHFLVQVDTALTDGQLVERCAAAGIRVRSLGSYYHGAVPETARRCLVVNYSGLTDAQLDTLEQKLQELNKG